MGVEGTSSSSSSLEICEYRPGKSQRVEAKEMGRVEVQQIIETPKQGLASEVEAEMLLEQIRENNERNWEMALQERLQQRQEQELRLVQKMRVVRKQADEFEKRRTTPY